jgi:RHS repeat-associated protein
MPPELPKPLNKFMNENRSGDQTLKLDARGVAITYAYDVLNRQSGKLYPNGTLVTFGYDAVNRQTQMQDIPTGLTTYLYDLQGRLIGYQPGLSQVALSYSYDGADNRTALSEAAAGRFTSFVYDPANNLTQIMNSYGERTTFVYDALNREKTSVRADNVLVSQSYDGNGEIISQKNAALSMFLTTFSYDPAGNRTGMDQFFPPSKNVNAAYSYDQANQLLGEVTEPLGGASGHGYISTYAYDGSGNWTTRLEEIALVSPFSRQYTTTYAHDNAGELTGNSAAWTGYPTGGSGASAATYTYDAAGNRLTANVGGVVTTYSWDYENRLIGATFSPLATLTSGILTNLYSSDGLRQGYADHTGITTLTYDILSQNIYRRDVLSTAATERYTNRSEAYGSPISVCRVAAATGAIVTNLFYNSVDGTDNINSLAAAGDNATAGNYVLYPAFGAGSANVPTIPSPLSTQPFQYMGAVGYYTDPSTGLIYVKARWYDPLTGIWLSEDPIGFEGGDWTSLYRYVGNEPLSRMDPSGNQEPVIDIDPGETILGPGRTAFPNPPCKNFPGGPGSGLPLYPPFPILQSSRGGSPSGGTGTRRVSPRRNRLCLDRCESDREYYEVTFWRTNKVPDWCKTKYNNDWIAFFDNCEQICLRKCREGTRYIDSWPPTCGGDGVTQTNDWSYVIKIICNADNEA